MRMGLTEKYSSDMYDLRLFKNVIAIKADI